MRMRLACAAVLLILGAGCGGVASPGASAAAVRQARTMVAAGESRSFITYRPATVAAGGAPLVIVLHGVPSSGAGMESLTKFDALADTQGFEVAYPDAVKDPSSGQNMWRLGCCSAWFTAPTDVLFISQLISTLATQDKIDPQRVYVMGFSWGAGMTYRLGCELSSKIAAIASVGGYQKRLTSCAPDRPVSVYEIHGTNDYYNGTCGGGTTTNAGCKPGDPGYAPSVAQLNQQWRDLDKCGAVTSTKTSGNITIQDWEGCSQNQGVGLNIIKNGTHCYPTPGSTSCASFDATREIWNFFASRRLAVAGFPGGTGGGGGGGTSGGGGAVTPPPGSTPVPVTPPGTAGTAGGGPLTVGVSSPSGATKRCVVPKLSGHSLTGARHRLAQAGCALGKVTRPKHRRPGQKLVVRHQSVKAGSRRSAGSKIRVTLGPAQPGGRT
jgi:polyhydroxybutyrate depolymerase